MIITGKIQIDLLKYSDCQINVSYGKINEINIPDVTPLVLASMGIKASTDYSFEKHYDPKKAPYKCNYYIRYKGGYESEHIIFLKLNFVQYYRMMFAMRKMLIQSDDIRKDFLKYIIGGVCGMIITIATQEVNKRYKAEPETPPKAESQKSLVHKNLNTETKKDKIIINSAKNAPDLNGAEAKPKI
jgi:hypothetical protein